MRKKQLEYYGTLGPSCAKEETLIAMFEQGMTGIRLNLSHRSLRESEDWIRMYQEAAQKAERPDADLLIDLIGPELRIGTLQEPLPLSEGERIWLGREGIFVEQAVIEAMKPGVQILLDDGKIALQAEQVYKDRAECTVIRGGILHSRKSIALVGISVNNATLTEKDLLNLQLANEYGVTAVMLPFVRGKADLICLRRTMENCGCKNLKIYAKIENMEGVEKLEELLPECDTVVIARGDLGNAMPLSKLPIVQQQISAVCREQEKDFLVVTQMLQSMTKSAVPTRAEVNDIFHAVRDGASALMLTGETAAGDYPVEAMKVLVETAEAACAFCTEKNTKFR